MPFYLLLIGSLSIQYVLVCNTELFLLGQKCTTDDVEYCVYILGAGTMPGNRHESYGIGTKGRGYLGKPY